ncbi:hypothetical protein D3C87_1714670 [compost metagenome]
MRKNFGNQVAILLQPLIDYFAYPGLRDLAPNGIDRLQGADFAFSPVRKFIIRHGDGIPLLIPFAGNHNFALGRQLLPHIVLVEPGCGEHPRFGYHFAAQSGFAPKTLQYRDANNLRNKSRFIAVFDFT